MMRSQWLTRLSPAQLLPDLREGSVRPRIIFRSGRAA